MAGASLAVRLGDLAQGSGCHVGDPPPEVNALLTLLSTVTPRLL